MDGIGWGIHRRLQILEIYLTFGVKVTFYHAKAYSKHRYIKKSSTLNLTSRDIKVYFKRKGNHLTQLYDKYKTRLLLRCIHHFKSDLINNMDHMRISGTEPSSVVLSQTK